MKRKISLILIAGMVASLLLLDGCYYDTYTRFSKVGLQIALLFDSKHVERWSPDFSWDVTDLEQHKEYVDNKDKIEKAEILHFNYRFDTLWYKKLYFGQANYDNTNQLFVRNQADSIKFDMVTFWGSFSENFITRDAAGKIVAVNTDPLDPATGNPKPGVMKLGEFKDVNISGYWREARNILTPSEEVQKWAADALKDKKTRAFIIWSQYPKVKMYVVDPADGQRKWIYQNTPPGGQEMDNPFNPDGYKRKHHFPDVLGKYDVIIRLEYNL